MVGRGLFRAAVLAGLMLAAAGGAMAQDSNPPPVQAPLLTLDDERLFNESRFGKSVLAHQEAEAQELISENRKIEAALETEEKDLTTRRASLSPEDFSRLSEAFNTKVEGIRKAQDAKSRDLTRQFEDDKLRFFEAVRPVLAQIMKERGAVAIIDKRAVFVGFENVDVTTAAIEALDATLGDDNAPAPPP